MRNLETLAREKPAADASNQPESSDRTIDLPPLKPEPERESRAPVAAGGGGGPVGFGNDPAVFILAAAAFFAGMAMRFQKETGDSLMDAIKTKAPPRRLLQAGPRSSGAPAESSDPAAAEK